MNMIKVILIIAICLSTFGQSKKIVKKIRLKDFIREGPLIFLTKMQMGTGNGQVDVSYQYLCLDAVKEVKLVHSHSTKTWQWEW